MQGHEGHSSLVHIEHRGHRPCSSSVQLLYISVHTSLIPPHLRASPHSSTFSLLLLSLLCPALVSSPPLPAKATDP